MKNMKTIFKTNIDKLEVTYTCSLEWRERLADTNRLICGEDNEVVLERIETSTSLYKHNFIIFNRDVFVGNLFFGSYNPNRPYIYLAIDNKMLYTHLAGITYIAQALNLQYYRLSKLDICLDTNKNIINKFYQLLKDEAKTIIVNNKSIKDRRTMIDNLIHFSSGSLKSIHKIKSFIIKGNEIELAGYDKGLEINKTRKDYIKDNLGLNKKIYRLEIRMTNYKQISKALEMCGIKMDEIYYHPFGESLNKVFYYTLNRIIRIKPNISILDYLFN